MLDSIDVSHVVGLRDRGVIGVMVYTFARIHAVLSLRIHDYFPQGKRWWLRLVAKNSKVIDMPVHHKLEEFLDSYIEAAGIADDSKRGLTLGLSGSSPGRLFRSTR